MSNLVQGEAASGLPLNCVLAASDLHLSCVWAPSGLRLGCRAVSRLRWGCFWVSEAAELVRERFRAKSEPRRRRPLSSGRRGLRLLKPYRARARWPGKVLDQVAARMAQFWPGWAQLWARLRPEWPSFGSVWARLRLEWPSPSPSLVQDGRVRFLRRLRPDWPG